MLRLIAIALLLFGCSRAKPEPATPAEEMTYDAVADRSLTFRDAEGFTSRGDHAVWGDRLIFTGLHAYGLDCARGAEFSAELRRSLIDPGTSPDADLDGLLGLYRGVVKRWLICGDDFLGDLIANKAWVDVHSSVLPPGFGTVAQALFAKAGLRSEPPGDSFAALETAATNFAGATVATHAACYRVNLSLLALQTVEALGHRMSAAGHALFCAGALPSRIATVAQFCGKPGLSAYVDAFQYDVWQYKHQRCDSWEQPDGTSEAGVDYLVAYRDLHGD